jgi:activator of 2-hydroxyglutaryl-CoA dehydratase
MRARPDAVSITDRTPRRGCLTGNAAVIGIDVGSTAVKAVVVDRESRDILWSDYQRHETWQAEKTLNCSARLAQHSRDDFAPVLRQPPARR